MAAPGAVVDWRMVVLVQAAAEAGVLDALPGTVDDLAARLALNPHGLQVVLDALGAWGVVDRDDVGGYATGAGAPDADAVAQLRHHGRAVKAWSSTIDKRLRGEPVENRLGMPDPEMFIDALGAGARSNAPGIVDLCLARFPDTRSVIDLGGGHGEYSLEFARRGLQVTLQDLPVMVDVLRRRGRLAEAGVELVAGSFFDGVPPGPFHLAFCAGITHTFDGRHNESLFRNLRPAVSSRGGVAVVTFLRHRDPMADVFAVQMLANGNGGDSHGEDQYRAWLGGAGFKVDDVVVDIPGRPQSALFAT
ncbi:MAG: acetylserotonin O-methyltransferase [Actinomycetota bacterium]|nr:acetylserotonin O-methyltransferase [Actinomycetota bacterium]